MDFAVCKPAGYNVTEDVLGVVYVRITAGAFDEKFTDAGMTW